ncbi:MAG: serine protease [Oligoflexia bacterium]|nr:MAG: serine protease [Oligoflexia bacterium]
MKTLANSIALQTLRLSSAGFFAIILVFTSQSFAERYLVVMKNKAVFAQAHAQFMMSNRTQLASIKGLQSQAVSDDFQPTAVVEDSLTHLNTLVVEISDEKELRALRASGQVALIEKEIFHPAPKPVQGFTLTRPWDYNLNYAQPMNAETMGVGPRTPWGIQAVRAPQAWDAARGGDGVRVLVLDTGIDKDHPSLGPNFEKGRDFVNDNNQPYSFADSVGHGSHCAGTIAGAMGADGFVGVAPRAKLLAGRVCSEEGCSNVAVAQGINWGISEKVDVISMSLGGPMATPAEKRAIEAADRAGISVVAASGNDGTPKVSYPAAFPTVVAVGAIDKTLSKAKFSQWGPELDIVAPGVDVVSSVPMGTGRESKVTLGTQVVPSTSFAGSPEVLVPASSELVVAGLGKPDEYKGAVGKFALVKRGEISFAEKVKNAIAAGVNGVVIYNNEPGLLQGALTQDGSIVAIPVVMIEQAVGDAAKNALDRGQKLNVTLQTVPTDYASFAGTSMATPHVAGVVALMKGANRVLKPAQVLQILKSTAQQLSGSNDQNQLGTGLVNAERAVSQSK